MRLTHGAAALILAGCTTSADPPQPTSTTDDPTVPTSDPVPVPDGALYPMFSIVEGTGLAPSTNGIAAFAFGSDAYLNATADPPKVIPGDFYFDVTSGGGEEARLGSLDDRSCRRIHIDEDGNIDQVYAGDGGCKHASHMDPTGRGKLLVQLAPFSPAPVDPGELAGIYCVSFERVGVIEGGSPPDGTCFFVVGTCGDGSVSGGETCDDGNQEDGDGCSASCQVEDPPPSWPVCGNGVLEEGEACDDANTTAGDGCSTTCKVEQPPPPPHEPACGDGTLDDGEACDDGNTASGDGCSATCTLEPPPCDP